MNNSIEIVFVEEKIWYTFSSLQEQASLYFNFIPANKEWVVSDPLKHEDCFKGRTIKRGIRGSRRGGLRGGNWFSHRNKERWSSQITTLKGFMNDPEFSACVIKIFSASDENIVHIIAGLRVDYTNISCEQSCSGGTRLSQVKRLQAICCVCCWLN